MMEDCKRVYVLSKAVGWKNLDDWVTNSNVLCVSNTLDKLLDYCQDKFNLSVVDIEQFEKWYCLEDVVDSDGELCALIIDWVAYL